MRRIYEERRDIVISALRRMGWDIDAPLASIYIWAKVPRGFDSSSFAELVLEKAGVIITPGLGYGANGEGYFRISLTVPTDRLKEALNRMENALGRVQL